MNVREGVIRSILSSHLEHSTPEAASRVMDVDRVGAFGLGSGKLAQFLMHWQASTGSEERAMWLRRAWRLLIRRTAKDFRIRNKGEAGKRSYAVLERACFQVLSEWAKPECITCAGVGKMGVKRYEVNNQTKVDDLVCQACSGTGTRRYSDRERMEFIGINKTELEKVWAERLGLILVEVTGALSRGMLGAKARLA
jgi:hypothetical protein